MAQEYEALTDHHRQFIARQRMFFTASAAPGAHANISPRATDWLRVLSDRAVAYLDRTGSGNETAAHALHGGHMTVMLCAVDGPPLILRLYGRGRVIVRGSAEYQELLGSSFGGLEPSGARQIVRLDTERVKTSCGYGVPLFEYAGERDQIERWNESKGEEGLVAYRQQKNLVSIDGLPTGFIENAAEPAE
jgi:hypothetical protein